MTASIDEQIARKQAAAERKKAEAAAGSLTSPCSHAPASSPSCKAYQGNRA